MRVSYESIPFSIESDSSLFTKLQGLIRIEENSLILEMQPVDEIFGKKKAATTSIDIPLKDVVALAYKKKMFGVETAMELRVSRQAILDDVMGSENGTLEMDIAWKHRKAANTFCDAVSGEISRRRSDRIQEDLNNAMSGSSGNEEVRKRLIEIDTIIGIMDRSITDIANGDEEALDVLRHKRREIFVLLRELRDLQDDFEPSDELKLEIMDRRLLDISNDAEAVVKSRQEEDPT